MRPRPVAFVTILTSSLLLLAQTALAGINLVGAETIGVSPKPDFMVSGDLNNDGLADIVVVAPTSKEVDVYLAADTPSHFAPARVFRFGQTLRRPALGDLNADGRLDIIVTDQAADSVWIMIGKGDGTFLTQYQVPVPNSRNPSSVAVGNFDDSGNADLAVADSRLSRIFILRNNNSNPPGFLRGGEIETGLEPDDVRAVDLNGDGHLDLLTLDLGGPRGKDIAVALWKQVTQGFPVFDAVQKFGIGENPSDLVIADFNNDSNLDVATLNRPAGGNGNSEIDIMLNQGGGILNPPTALQVPCPFFTGGAPCRSLAMVAADLDGNGKVDLAVALSDPRRSRGSASQEADAMQVFGGSGDGNFVPGGVFATQKNPVSMAVGDVSGDQKPDIVVANQRTLDLQAFINVSTPGSAPNGDPCLLGEECLSDRCTNGVCCAAECNPETAEVCNVPGREGTCVPIPPAPVACTLPDQPECQTNEFCVDGFCCDDACIGGHCDTDGYIGVCIPGIPDGGGPCTDGHQCSSNFCSPNEVCCREACDAGFCDSDGVCREKSDNGTTCEDDAECKSNVCDTFDLICCNRKCSDAEVCFMGEGVCRPFDYTPPVRTSTPTATMTPSPRSTPAPTGELCSIPGDCQNGFCVNGVCCSQSACPVDQHCEQGTGNCVLGSAGSPTPTASPTPINTIPTPNPCGVCPSGTSCQIVNGSPVCISTSNSGGCSTVGDSPARGNLVVVALLPLALWASRRWQLRRARVRARAPRH
jgi:hypothetical protein